MPEGYENMRDDFEDEGMSKKGAKKKAAKIWNKNNPDNPVTRKKHESITTKGGPNVESSKILTDN